MLAPFEITLGRSGFGEGKCLTDNDLKLFFLNKPEDFVELFKVFRFGLEIIRDRESSGFPTVTESRQRVGKGAKGPANREKTPAGRERLQALLENFAADHLQHDINTAIFRCAHDFRQKAGFGDIDGDISAQLSQSSTF